ncbi:MAG: adenine deaminase [Bacteroidetes bacterium]|nr:adenine deaminase [Bacteroidota bacterium]
MDNKLYEISGHIVDVINRRIFKGVIIVNEGRIEKIVESEEVQPNFILPGLIDAHIHIESSMLIPSEFARLAVVHGTIGTVSDPHEIANVLGIEGIRFMISNGKKVAFKFCFGASSCVPATPFETAGAGIGLKETEDLLRMDEVKYLSEMMNFPGVLGNDPVVMQKIALARKYNKPVDGHAPGLRGEEAKRYIESCITTDHECYTIDEAREKIGHGMKILIREGSAARNFEALSPLIDQFPESIMFCSDDLHPNDLVKGHINEVVKRSIGKGYDIMNTLRACTVNPVVHYKLDAGLLRPGDPADFIVADNLDDFNILATYVDGGKVAENGKSLIPTIKETSLNTFNASLMQESDIRILQKGSHIRVMEAMDGQLITRQLLMEPKIAGSEVVSDMARDILKIVVKDRYRDAPPVVAFVRGFGLERGAIASSVAHDSHNIIAVGTDDRSIVEAINMVSEAKGGISLADTWQKIILPLPVAGIMSPCDGYQVAELYDQLNREVKNLGTSLQAPYMTLSFMALLVIPELKISDKGLFDVNSFDFTDLFVEGF